MKSIIYIGLIILVAGIILAGQKVIDDTVKYEINPPELTDKTKEMMSNIYLDPIDPNDTIYSGLAKPLPEWLISFADSERSRIIFNLTVLNRVTIQNQQRIVSLEARIKELEKPVDPNEVKQ